MNPQDIILNTDLDEIPKRDKLKKLIDTIKEQKQDVMYHFQFIEQRYNIIEKSPITTMGGGFLCRKRLLKNKKMLDVRFSVNDISNSNRYFKQYIKIETYIFPSKVKQIIGWAFIPYVWILFRWYEIQNSKLFT